MRRRELLWQSSLLAGAALWGCRAPTVVDSSVRQVASAHAAIPAVDGAGMRLWRAMGHRGLQNLDPFILVDHLESRGTGGKLPGFPNHPHRGFETVSLLLEGQVRHHDSRGNAGLVVPGGAQWMTAGRGIVHSEMPEEVDHALNGFQVWVNLPAKEKLCVPRYQEFTRAQLAEKALSSAGSQVRVVAGEFNGLVGPNLPRPTEPSLMTLRLADDLPVSFGVPSGHTAFVFVDAGEVEVGPESAPSLLSKGTLAVLGPGARVRLRAREGLSSVLFGAGRPLREPLVQRGPFVMNTEDEVQRAFADYRSGALEG